jgi:hypothetical protein
MHLTLGSTHTELPKKKNTYKETSCDEKEIAASSTKTAGKTG